MLKCICGPNLEILTSICGDLWYRETKNWVNFDFEVQFDLEGQGQTPNKTIGILTKVFYTSGPNLVILASMGPELSRWQASDWYTYTHTQTQATTIPGGQKWPRVKMAHVNWDTLAQSAKLTTSSQLQTSENSFGLVKIIDGLVEFFHDYRETSIWKLIRASGKNFFSCRLLAQFGTVLTTLWSCQILKGSDIFNSLVPERWSCTSNP